MKIVLTGASGFLGKGIMNTLKVIGRHTVIGITRSTTVGASEAGFTISNIDSLTDWTDGLQGADVIIHTAARVHIMNDLPLDNLAEYRKVNVDGTINLANQAIKAKVKRFIFISSIKVNGESTTGLPAFTEKDDSYPLDPYGISKMEAEEGLLKISQDTSMEIVIIRPPLVYGPGVKANFFSLMKLANTSIPLPFGAVRNARSMVYVGNLVDFIVKCVDHPAAANQVFLISDGDDVSLSELMRLLRLAMVKSICLIPVPASLFRAVGLIIGKSAVVERLVGSLQIDSSKAQELLNWQPPYTVEQGIKATVDEFLKSRN